MRTNSIASSHQLPTDAQAVRLRALQQSAHATANGCSTDFISGMVQGNAGEVLAHLANGRFNGLNQRGGRRFASE